MARPHNHPKKGDRIAVEPIRSVKAIKAIGQYRKDRPRDHLLFVMGVNNGLRTCDLLRLKVGQVRGLKPGDAVTIKESKTGKENTLAINKTVHKALRLYLDTAKPADGDWLFPSRKGAGPLKSWQAVDKQESGCRARRGRFRKSRLGGTGRDERFPKGRNAPGGLSGLRESRPRAGPYAGVGGR